MFQKFWFVLPNYIEKMRVREGCQWNVGVVRVHVEEVRLTVPEIDWKNNKWQRKYK